VPCFTKYALFILEKKRRMDTKLWRTPYSSFAYFLYFWVFFWFFFVFSFLISKKLKRKPKKRKKTKKKTKKIAKKRRIAYFVEEGLPPNFLGTWYVVRGTWYCCLYFTKYSTGCTKKVIRKGWTAGLLSQTKKVIGYA